MRFNMNMLIMKKTGILFVALLVLLMAGCKPSGKKEISDNTSALKGYISLSGAFALYPIVVLWADEFRKVNPGVRIDISAGGAGKGIADALSGMVDLGMVSREISPQEVDLGAWYIALTKDAVLPTINAANPYYNELSKRGVTKEQLYDVFVTGNITTWDELVGKPAGTKIRLYTRSDACGAASMWASFLGKTQEELLGTGVFGDPGIADAIKNDPLGLGYNNVNYVFDIRSRKKFDKMEVLPIDLDSNGTIDENENNFSTLDKVNDAIVKGDYPSPPARDLYFVSKGRPEKPEVTAFIEYILTEGQKFVGEAGYVPLSEEKINKQLEKLNP
jgi:phosphate transport system substrate-binding protein